jgi:exopolyphosphatase / guanosine-5'-triphosphate,3'-diphosphate pyrophosphatase
MVPGLPAQHYTVLAMRPRADAYPDVTAVIDVGSNSGRVVVFERDTNAHLRTLAGSRASLRLIADVDRRGELSESTMARVAEALRDFRALAIGSGATRIVAVATAAMRDASNGPSFVERLRRELGISVDIISGAAEARYGFAGAIRGLGVSNGLLFDVGGGSMQLTRFDGRRRGRTVSLPLGALRLSERFLESDPPRRSQLRRLRDHARDQLKSAGLDRFGRGDRLVGTGGTLRNLAKIDHAAQRYPIATLHGYELPLDRLTNIVELLARLKEKRRDTLQGLSADRADSIVGGAVAIETVARFVGAASVLVSGQGVREGLALELLDMQVGSPDAVREASISSLVTRFTSWRQETATRRESVAATLYKAIEPHGHASVATAVRRAAGVLDIGRALDLTNRHAHAADIILTTELNGFTHGELALLAAIMLRAGNRHADVEALVRIAGVGRDVVERAAIILTLADEIEARCPPGRPIGVRSRVGQGVTVSIAALPSWLEGDVEKRFERAFERRLIVRR